MTKKTKIILIALIVFFIGGMAFYPSVKQLFAKGGASGASPKDQAEMGKKRPLNVNAQIVKYETLEDNFPLTGSIMPDEEVDLSFETSGKIVNIYFKEGTTVKKGELLAKVNDDPLQAELKKLQAQVPLAEDRVFRQKSLLAKDAVSKEAYEQVTTELGKLNADIDLAKARIAQTELRAPFDGIIGLRLVSEGQYASPSTIVAKLTKVIPLKIEFSLSERHAGIIKDGTQLTFTIDGDLNQYQATVYATESKLDMKTRTLKARAIYPNQNGRMKPGRYVSIKLRLQEIKNTLTAPSEAIIAEMGRDIAYTYSQGKAKQIVLTKGLRTESKVQIIKGLQTGDTLITSGIMQLRNDMPVTLDNIVN
ncbi:MAG: efflux RND transporter periplasmic adaptor subunit [Dysgonamonadaceae bacterium]|jgi:membrane fusion protein (multidrug efflux system)|nr:efflux RND transporter periplasmic adaptor subunit [Dysgonamonadaceae bacterium]